MKAYNHRIEAGSGLSSGAVLYLYDELFPVVDIIVIRHFEPIHLLYYYERLFKKVLKYV